MKLIKVSLLCLCQTLYLVVNAEAQGWRGLTPLASTRKDVEQLLGPSKEPDKYAELYNLGSEAVFIEYSSAPCNKDRDGGWDVPSNTIIAITISSAKKKRLDDLDVNLSKYTKTEDPELPGNFFYYYDIDGISITASADKVESITYGPMAKDKHLLCRRLKATQ